MSTEKELAYRYDLFVTPDWRDRFDVLVNENVSFPKEGRILDVNCGTGAHAAELAAKLGQRGEVIGVDASAERLEIARAKTEAQKLKNLAFQQAPAHDLPFETDQFDAVIGDASMLHDRDTPDVLAEMIRVARAGAAVVLKLTTHGSFDEFFSLYWEALLGAGAVDETWPSLEELIVERSTTSAVEKMAKEAGLRDVTTVSRKEEFSFSTAAEFFESPVIKDHFLAEWLEILPEEKREQILQQVIEIVDRERHEGPFEVSIKATVLTGVK
jgi:ubiquinone/menaquinone biosynthesis C-methylase UbiE